MKYKALGSSGLKVAEICLGTMTFGEEFGIGAPENACREIYAAYREAGGNFVDTADIYNAGTSERMLGAFIADERDRIVLASKYSLNTRTDDPNAGGSHRKNLVQSLEASLKRLGTEYIDLYWVHAWDGSTGIGDVMRALDDQVRKGKILHIGISNAPAWVISAANTLAVERGWTPFTAMQLHYNLIERSIEHDYFALADAQNMAITPWSPLAGGLLTGKFNRNSDQDAQAGTRLADSPRRAQVLQDKNLDIAARLVELAKDVGCSPAQLALAWMMQRTSSCVVPIIGARRLTQLQDNLGAAQVGLDAARIAALDELSAPETIYPQTLYASDFFRTMMYGEAWEKLSLDRPWK
jgi:aryl-alcohol dehydrogenase-like predicted oxidoreductase